MNKAVIPSILTAHALCVLLFMTFCTDADNPWVWAIIYYLTDPLFFGLFGLTFKAVYTETHMNKNFISIWGFINFSPL